MSDELGGILQAVGEAASGLMSGGGAAEPMDSPEQRRKEEDYVRVWFKRISRARDAKKKWESNYEVERSHDYVRGFQRDEDDEYDAQGERKYQRNMILASLKAKIPRIFYYHPYIRVRPTRGREDTPGQLVSKRAELLQDTVNTVIRMPRTRFKEECELALKEANWAFGVVEVGYEADWGENPFAKKPPLVENEETERELSKSGRIPEEGSLEELLSDFTEIPYDESFYVKHVPARQFFVSSNDKSSTEAMDWIGYWEWMYVRDVKKSKAFKGTEDLKPTAKLSGEDSMVDKELSPMADERGEDIPSDMVRVWKLWDLRERKRVVLAEGHDRILKEEEYRYVSLYTLRLEIMPGEWYPIPPIFQQLQEQDEHNDGREWLRMVRKGTRPRYQYDKNALSAEELDKLENDEYNVLIGAETSQPAIIPIAQPQYNDAAIRTLGLSEAGFGEQAASSPTARLTRGAGGAPTATEVTALEGKGDIRDSYEQQATSIWLAAICRGILDCAVDRMVLPKWILLNSDPHSPAFVVDAMQIFQILQQIKDPIPDNVAQLIQISQSLTSGFAPQRRVVTPDELEESYGIGDWDITVDIESMSPTSESQHAARILQALQLIAGPLGELLALSPELLKLMLNLMGIRSAQDQQAIAKALQTKMMMAQMMMMAQAVQSKGGSAPKPPGQAPLAGGQQPNAGAGGGPPSQRPQNVTRGPAGAR